MTCRRARHAPLLLPTVRATARDGVASALPHPRMTGGVAGVGRHGRVLFLGPAGQPGAPAPSPPPPRTKWTRRVPHPVLIGHAASLTPYTLSALYSAPFLPGVVPSAPHAAASTRPLLWPGALLHGARGAARARGGGARRGRGRVGRRVLRPRGGRETRFICHFIRSISHAPPMRRISCASSIIEAFHVLVPCDAFHMPAPPSHTPCLSGRVGQHARRGQPDHGRGGGAPPY